ncbi:MAG: zf-HC2 domain-containing protein [Bacteroidetes bacterium]|nr:zf-HC2 domain-containing protein [Bacteroidota bacterium]
MNCDYFQEKLSAFLDREGSFDDVDGVLSHLYGCDECKAFITSAIKLRSLAGRDKVATPPELDDSLLREVKKRRIVNPLSYRLKLPVYVVSAAAVVLLVLSFAFGYMMQADVHQREMKALMQSSPAGVLYSMPTQVVYPVSMHEWKGAIR